MNWVQPKYLGKEKIGILKDRMNAWIEKAQKVLGDLQENGAGLLNN